MIGVLLCTCLQIILSIVTTVESRHWIPTSHEVVHGVRIGHISYVKAQPFDQSLRFQVHYHSSVNELSRLKQRLVKNRLIPSAVRYFHKTYSVRSTKKTIKLQRMCKDNSYFLKSNKENNGGDVQYCKGKCMPTTCGPIKVPETFLDDCRVCNDHGTDCHVKSKAATETDANKGRKTDFILFVSAIPTQHCLESNIVAYASYCQQENAMNRPVAGFANLCPGKLETDVQSFENLLATVKHEIYHALGFSVGLYAFYRDKNGTPLTERDKHGLPRYNNVTRLYTWNDRVMKKFVRRQWSVSGGHKEHSVDMIVTPTVKREVRKHFNCEDLEGAELENQGGEGTALTHWEKRVFENEAMTGTYTQHPVFSRITLALMEDTGWYKADYNMAEKLDWGRGLGCLFVKNNCRAWIADRIRKKRSTAPFCATLKQSPLHMKCTHTKLSLALCNLVKYTNSLPRQFQYFDRLGRSAVKDISSYGGAVELADFCPFYQKFTLTDESGRKRGTTCTLAENSPSKDKNYALEKYGAVSKCVEHGRHWTAKKGLLTRTMLDWGSGCYNYKCTNKGLVFVVAGKEYPCSNAEQRVEIGGLMNDWKVNGSIICPPCEEFCGTGKHCNSNFVGLSKSSSTDLEEKETIVEIQNNGCDAHLSFRFRQTLFLTIMTSIIICFC
eukprot:gene625-1290_t